MKHTYQEDVLILYLEGEFDSYHVAQIKQQCIQLIEEYNPKKVILDFKSVSFVDSTGIGFVLARYKQCKAMNCKLSVANMDMHQHALFAMSGLFQLVEVEEKI